MLSRCSSVVHVLFMCCVRLWGPFLVVVFNFWNTVDDQKFQVPSDSKSRALDLETEGTGDFWSSTIFLKLPNNYTMNG